MRPLPPILCTLSFVPLVLIHASPLYFARQAKRKDDSLGSPASVQASSVPKRRWGIALLLGFGVLVNYFDRVNLSDYLVALDATFGVSTVMFGYLLSAYNWTYALL